MLDASNSLEFSLTKGIIGVLKKLSEDVVVLVDTFITDDRIQSR